MGSAADDVAGLPGGAAVTAAANKIAHANVGSINAAADRLTKAGADVGGDGTGVANAVRTLDDAWQGASADQFVAYMGRFSAASTAMGDGMNKAGAALKKVAQAVDDAQHFVNNRCEQVLTEARQWAQRNKEASQDQYNAAMSSLTSAAATDIDNKLKETEAAMSSAATEIQAATQPSARFSDIPDPTTQPYVPGPGKQIQWDPSPEKKADTHTGTQSATPPSGSNTGSGSGSHSGGSGHSGGGGGSHGGGSHGGGGGMGSSGGPPAGPVPGNVQDWIKQAQEILRANGINVPDSDVPKIWAIIQHESGGNPHAVNNWDSNAAKGTPSKGLMQCIDPTFNSYKLPGHDDIWNPVDNICAGVNYAIKRYGSLDNVPGIKAMAGGGAYRGY
jgi:uncharacterized protein YukE